MHRSANNTIYILREWIKVYKLGFEHLSKNPNAINLLRERIDTFTSENWKTFSMNPCIFKKKKFK
jgi:hypothetical protein